MKIVNQIRSRSVQQFHNYSNELLYFIKHQHSANTTILFPTKTKTDVLTTQDKLRNYTDFHVERRFETENTDIVSSKLKSLYTLVSQQNTRVRKLHYYAKTTRSHKVENLV